MKTTPAVKSSPVSSPVVEKPFWLRFEYQLRRFGFIFLLLIVFAAMFGIFSHGYLSDTRLANDDHTLTVDYEKFNRLMSDTDLKITATTSPGKPNRIILGGDFMNSFRIDTLQPQPDNMYSLNGKMAVEYKAPAAGAEQTLWLSLTPMKMGAVKSTISVDNGPEISFRQFIYP